MNSIHTHHKGTDPEEQKMHDKRNKLLLAFLLANSLNNIRLIGNAKSPIIVYNDEIRLACFVVNYTLILQDSIGSGAGNIGTLELRQDKIVDAEGLMLDFLHNSHHEPVYRIGLKIAPGLFLSGYNYLDKVKKLGKEPVFSILESRIFISKQKAELTKYELANYELEII